MFNRFFEFSPAQIKLLIILTGFWLALSTWSLINGYSSPGEEPLRISLQIGRPETEFKTVFRVDLNHAPADSLELLPGIGPVLAGRIVAYRDSVGRFEKPEDIMHVQGIGHATFERLRPYLEVSTW